MKDEFQEKSIAALPVVLLLVLLISGLILTISFLFVQQRQGEILISQAREAFHFAEAGVYDAILKIDRDLTFESTGSGYTIDFDRGQANVVVQRNVPGEDKDTIWSTGECKGSKKKIKVVIQIDSSTGKVSVLSWQEVEI